MIDLNSFMSGGLFFVIFGMIGIAIKQILDSHIEDVVDKYLIKILEKRRR